MAAHFEVFAERQPWEEQQVESPTHDPLELSPLELALSRTRSPTSPKLSRTRSPTSPTLPAIERSPTSPQQLSRRLSSASGDPESPPPAWKRRPSVGHRSVLSTSSHGTDNSVSLANSPPSQASSPPSQPQPLPSQRRHPPNLVMTRAGVAQRILRENEPPHLRVPVPNSRGPPGSYRRRAATTSSNRSSLHSQDGATSEDLWNMEDDAPDMSNPMRPASERPLDTINRISQRFDQPIYPMGVEVLWPTAPPDSTEYMPPPKTKSLTNMSSMKRRSGTLRKRNSQGGSMNAPYDGLSITPSHSKDALSSAHSSSTSLSVPMNKSQASLNRPTSYSYSLDLLSTLMPREGGYALAAQIGYSHSGSPISPVDDRRSYPTHPPNTYRGPRGPAAKSSGMRWSVEPEENYSPPPVPGGRLSPATTVSSLGDEYDNSAPATPQYTSAPVAPSPLSQQTTAADVVDSPTAHARESPMSRPAAASAVAAAGAAGAAAAAAASASPKRNKTKKELKAEEKAAKAEAKRLAVEKAEAEAKAKVEAKRAEALAKQEAAKKEKQLKAEAAAKAKAEAARKKDEEKERAKARTVKRVPSFRRKSQVVSSSTPPPAPPSGPPSGLSPANVAAPQQRVVSAPVNGTAAPVNGSAARANGSAAPLNGSAAPVAAAASAPIVIPQRSTSAAPRAVAHAPATAAPGMSNPVPTGTPQNATAPVPTARAAPPAPAPASASAPVSTAAPSPAPAPAAPVAAPAAAPPAPAPAVAPREPAPAVTPVVAAAAAAAPAAIAATAAATASPVQRAAPVVRPPEQSLASAPRPHPQAPAEPTRPVQGPGATRPVQAPAETTHPVRAPASAPSAPRPEPTPQPQSTARPSPARTPPGRAPPALAVPTRTPSSTTTSNRTPSPSVSGSTVRASNSSEASIPKKGLFSSLKKRFSISALDSSPNVPSRPRPKSVILSQSEGKKEKGLPAVPVVNNLSPPKTQGQSQSPRRAAAPTQVYLPPPIVVPPRNSSLATSSAANSNQEIDSGECPSSLSNPSSVIVTPTASMAATSTGSLFDIRPSGIRKGSDSATSASASNMTDHGELDKAPVSQIPSAVAAH